MRRVLFLLPFVVAASCGGVISGSDDGGSDAASTCSTNADCPNGACGYPDKAGCAAHKQCFSPVVACKGGAYCACDGTTMLDDCGGRASKPVAHFGSCSDGGELPPPDGCALSCEVCDVTGFTVTPQSTPNQATNACSAQDISSFVTACLSASATQSTCTNWEKSDAGGPGCFACLVTQDISTKWGPLVCSQSSCTINVGGCMDIVSGQVVIENGTNGSCGDLTNAADECVDYACGACTDSSASTTCANDAEQVECKSYFDAAANASVCGLVDAGPTTCSPQSDADWAAFLNVFCGTGP
jgi:hypothetical protein